MDRTNLVLISGAISNSLEQFKVNKLEGEPFVFIRNFEVIKVDENQFKKTVESIVRIFKDKNKETCIFHSHNCTIV